MKIIGSFISTYKYTIYFIPLLITSHIFGGSFSESSFPGGYLSIGLQIGKTEDKTRYIDIQINPSIVLVGPYKHDSPGYLFIGSSLGKRYSEGKLVKYFDMNLNFWNTLFTFGIGRGFILEEGQNYLRKKYWGGLGFIPVILCTDNYYINDRKYKQIGIMGILPFPLFGNNFYP